MNYRREIDGLRALAVLPVIFFHAGFNAFSGGFVGVDIFFVISGYLITSIILVEKTNNKFSLLGFYERRARRILPALFVVLFACLPLAWLLLLPVDMWDFSKSLVYVSVFSSNFLFFDQSGYFDTAAELKPLLHTWSLAVEEQYYLLFPVFLLLIWRAGKAWIFALTLGLTMASLILADHNAYAYPAAAFYLLSSRVWELLTGALIAIYLFFGGHHKTPSPKISSFFSIVGVILISYSTVFFDKYTPYPSLYTLLPVVGSGLIILFVKPNVLVGKWLSHKYLVGIGLISYSLYLWHQPLFAFAKHGHFDGPPILIRIVLLFIITILSYLTWRYVEKPFRDKTKITRKKVVMFSLVGSCFFIAFGLVGLFSRGFEYRFPAPKIISDDLSPFKMRAACDKNYDKKGWKIDFCLFGDVDNKQNQIALFGDSHSDIFVPAFDVIGKKLGKSVAHIGLGGCPPFLGINVLVGDYERGVCEALAKREFEYVKQNKIKKVFLAGRWALYTDGMYNGSAMRYLGIHYDDKLDKQTSRKAFEEGLTNTVKAYKNIGAEVYVIAQVPQRLDNAKEIYLHTMQSLARSRSDQETRLLREAFFRDLSVPFSEHHRLQEYNRKLFADYAAEGKITLISFDAIFCDAVVCAQGINDKPYYIDFTHLSTYGASLTVPQLIEYVK